MWKPKFIILVILLILSGPVSLAETKENGYLDYKDEAEILELLVEPIVEEAITEEPIVEEFIEIKKFDETGIVIREGIVGTEVLRVKRFFKEKGYINVNENYYFDNRLYEIILNYQLSHGLSADGTIGKNTYEKINEHMKFYKMDIPEISITFTAEAPEGLWIIINKASNTLYLLKGREIINRYNIATGKSPLHTPEGKFTIVTKYVNPGWGGAGRYRPIKGGAVNNPLGKRWMGLSVGGGSIYGIHGNSDFSSIGKYVSLGCIRMFNQDAEYIFDLVNKGTPVWIGNELRLKEYGILFK